MQTTPISLNDTLPLTCTRAGTCCHGNRVLLNPWELAVLALEKKVSPKEFRETYTIYGGIQLNFGGKTDHRGKKACLLFDENQGCSVHASRPLACRLFPLGRQIQNGNASYLHEGDKFPCLNGCSEVNKLPQLRVDDYLKSQATEPFERAQDAYLEILQNLADLAFELLLDTGLAQSGDTKTIAMWRKMGSETSEQLAQRIGENWLDALTIPAISVQENNPETFVEKHNYLLQTKAQESFAALQTNDEFHEASVLLMCLALFLAKSIGANSNGLAEHWCEVAQSFGSQENI